MLRLSTVSTMRLIKSFVLVRRRVSSWLTGYQRLRELRGSSFWKVCLCLCFGEILLSLGTTLDGQITESGTYRQLVKREDSRFRQLMAAQLIAASGERKTNDSSPPEAGQIQPETHEMTEGTDETELTEKNPKQTLPS
jgi:hypothetical protein